MTVTLTGHLLATGQNRLDIADGDMHVRRIAGILLNDAGDELALLAGEGAEDLVVLGLTEQLSDDLARGGRGEAPEVARGVVVLLAQLRSSSVGSTGISLRAHTVNVPARVSSSTRACLAA